MDISAFNLRDIQTFLALLNTVEIEGVTDLRFVRQRLQERVDGKRLGMRRDGAARRRLYKDNGGKDKHPALVPCPSCGLGVLVQVLNNEGLRVVGCKVCRYSRIDGVL
jgi:hypothetical protein